MKKLILAVVVLGIAAQGAWGLDLKQRKPLSEKDAAELFMLAILLDGVRQEFIKAAEKGEDPAKVIAGRTYQELFHKWKRPVIAKWGKDAGIKGETAAASRKPARGKGEVAAGNGFYYRNTSVKGGLLPMLFGEMINRSRRNYQMAIFQIGLYDAQGRLIGTAQAMLQNFPNNSERSFQALLADVNAGAVARYKIQFSTGM